MSRRRTAVGAAALLACLGVAPALWAWEGQGMIDTVPTAALVQPGAGQPWTQTEFTELTAQGALSDSQSLGSGLSLSGTAWAMADSLPSGDPRVTPASKVDLQTRLLELKLSWEAIPGSLIWDVGKKVIHPSSGFFRTPLNVMSRGALGNSANISGSAVGTWEEGWIGTEVTFLTGPASFSNFFSPRLRWTGSTDQALQYVTQQQPDFQDLARVDLRLGEADVRLLGLLSSGGPGSADPDVLATLGAGVDTNVGDAITVRAEASAAQSRTRLEVTDAATLQTGTQTVSWAPSALAGFTWTNADQLSVMAEYWYNGLGLSGAAYTRLIDYMRTRRSTLGSPAPDVMDQFGTLTAAQHYGFVRVSGKIDDSLSAAAWTAMNLQDPSGLSAVVLTLTHDAWTVNASAMDAWGSTRTEAGLLPMLWRIDLQVSLFL